MPKRSKISDENPDWAQLKANRASTFSDNGKTFQLGLTPEVENLSKYSSGTQRLNIRVNHSENDRSWTPFLNRHSPESDI